jgi:hypothetical protein
MKQEDYIKGDRHGREAHDIELEAMRDPLLSEALEGFDAVDNDRTEALARLRERVHQRVAVRMEEWTTERRRYRRRMWLAVAAAIIVAAVVCAWVVWVVNPSGGRVAPPAVDSLGAVERFGRWIGEFELSDGGVVTLEFTTDNRGLPRRIVVVGGGAQPTDAQREVVELLLDSPVRWPRGKTMRVEVDTGGTE